MKLDKDFNEFVELFVARGVRFLVIGGYALAAHGYPRATDDLMRGCGRILKMPRRSLSVWPRSVLGVSI